MVIPISPLAHLTAIQSTAEAEWGVVDLVPISQKTFLALRVPMDGLRVAGPKTERNAMCIGALEITFRGFDIDQQHHRTTVAFWCYIYSS